MENLTETVQSAAFKDMSAKVDKMYYALMGNELSKDGGLVQRIIELEGDNAKLEVKLNLVKEELENKIEELEKEVEEVKVGKAKSEIYLRIIYGLVGVASTAVIGAIVNYIFNK